MNPTIDLLMKRRSVRNYSEQPILPAEREAILKATLRAPTAGNMTLYSIIEISDPVLKKRLAETCDQQPFIGKAPLVLAFLADYQRWYDYYRAAGVEAICRAQGLAMRKPAEGDLFLAMCDTLIAAQTAVTAAESLGIGSCYIGDFLERYEIHRELLDLPPYVLPVTLVCFGYPLEESSRLTSRFEAGYIVHENRYRRLGGEELIEMMRERSEQIPERSRKPGNENMGQANYFRKFSAGFSLEMTRSVQAMLESWKKGE